MSDFDAPRSPSQQAPPAFPPPTAARPAQTPAYYRPPIGRVPERLRGPYYSIGLVILLSFVTHGVWTYLWVYRTGEDMKKYNGDGLGGVTTLVLHLLGIPSSGITSIVLMFTIPNEIKNMYQRDGRQSPVSAVWGLWFLLPLIGNIVWYVRVQSALNDFWLSKGAQPG